jgi:hypothetical protein
MEAWMAASAREAVKEAWKVAKNALQQVEEIMAEFSVFQLKLHFLAWMFLIETPGRCDKLLSKWHDCCYLHWKSGGLYRWNNCLVDFESRHLHQCPRGKLIYDWWVGNSQVDMIMMSNGCFEKISDGRFVEMVGIIKKTIHKSQTLEMLVGGWQHSREE